MNAPHPIPAANREPLTRADFIAAARARQAGAGFASPFLAVTDEQLAQADAAIGWRLEKARQKFLGGVR